MTIDSLRTKSPAGGNFRWVICALLFFVITVNYVDRQVISVLKPLIGKDLGWSEVDYGNIVTSFQASYGIGLLMMGRFLDRIGTRAGLSIAIALWSVAAAFHSGARTVLQFILARAALGFAESAAFPGSVKSMAEWLPKHERALGVGIFNAGSNVGVLLTPIIGLWVAAVYGWRWAFLVTALLGLLVLAAWIWLYHPPAEHPSLSKEELTYINSDGEDAPGPTLSWRQAITHRQTWAYICGKFFTDPVWYLFLFWLPDFLQKTQGMNLFPTVGSGILATIGSALIGVYLLADVGSVLGGWLSSHLIKRGWSVNWSRKFTMLLAALCATPLVFVVGVPNPTLAVLLIGLATAGHQAFSANLYTLISDMYPKRAVATVVGMGSAAGTVGGILMAQTTGRTLELTGSYLPLLIYAAFAYLLALLLIHRLVPKLEPAPLHRVAATSE